MKHGFSVTYERYLPHDDGEDICEPDEHGFVCENVTFRAALREIAEDPRWARGMAVEADEYPARCPRWFDFFEWNEGTRERIEQGIRETRALHVPDAVTPASRLRIARWLGCRC
jgi:hypothetical protein